MKTLQTLIDELRRGTRPAPGIALPQGPVAVLAVCRADLFGGPLSQLLRCLAAAKICEGLGNRGIDAAPVCQVRAPRFPREIHLLDRRYGLHRLALDAAEADGGVCGPRTAALLDEIDGLFPSGDDGGGETGDFLASLKDAFAPGADFASANVRWLDALLRPWGMPVLGPGENPGTPGKGGEPLLLPDGRRIPVAVVVAEPEDAGTEDAWPEDADSDGGGGRERDGAARPVFWQRPRVTVSTARIDKTLHRYALDPARLGDGLEAALGPVREKLRSDVPARLLELDAAARAALAELEAHDARDRRFAKARQGRGARILYQLEKLRRHTQGALAHREQAAEGRIRKACDFLAPLGRRQDEALGLLQIPLRCGAAGLQALYDKLDATSPSPQWITLD